MRSILRLMLIEVVVGLVPLIAGTPSTFIYAQETTAKLSGTVLDTSGAAVPNATIVLTNESTKAEVTQTRTNGGGSFSALQVPAGKYTLTVQANGFERYTLTGISLTIAQDLQLPVTLQPGAASTNITVSASTQPQLQNAATAISTVLNPKQVQDLPLPNRDITQLIALVPGTAIGGSPTSFNDEQLSINGSRTLNTEILLDGSSVINGATGNPNRLPSPDDLSQFRVITATAPAEYGRTSGAVITIGTRSGTGAFHGGVYELFQNAAMNANSYFNNMQTPIVPRSADNYNQFGATFGGPVWIPHVYDGRKRTFFYLNYNQTISHSPATATESIPSTAFASGDFSSSPVTINDPLTHLPFPNNTIPAGRIDPAAAKILSLLPRPNTTGTYDAVSNRYTNNYFTQQTLSNSQPIYSGRLDHAIGDNIRLFGSLTRQIDPAAKVVLYNDILNPSYPIDADQGWEGALGYTQELSPTLVLNLGFGTSRDVDVRLPSSLGTNPTQTIGIGTAPALLTPQINITNYSSAGTGGGAYSQTYSNGFNFFGSITKVLGAHTIKAGASLRKNQLNIFNPGVLPGGSYNFTGEITSPTSTAGTATNALADFLLGAVKTSSYGLPQPLDGRRNYNVGVYAQDNYKFNPKLLINAGVRWEYESPMTISNNQYSRINPTTGVLLVANHNASQTLNITTPKADFAPRLGLIFSPNQSTVVRAGYGNYYGLIFSNLGGQVGYPGYEVSQSFNNLGTGVAQPFTLSQGQPLTGVAHLNDPGAVLATATVSAPYNPSSVEFAKVNPLSLIQEWNLGVQQQFFKSIVLEVDYVGSHGVHLPLVLPANYTPFGQAAAIADINTTTYTQEQRPFPTIGQYSILQNEGVSSYNSLQVTARRQFESGVAFSASYTWSHSLDDGSGVYNYSQPNGLNGGEYPQDSTFRETQDRSSSAFDIRNSFEQNASYTTKGPWFTRNFLISDAMTARTGFPLTITQTTEFSGAGSQRPNGSSASLKISPYKNGTGIQYFVPDTASKFPLTPSGPVFVGSGATRKQVVPASLGTLGRYSIYGPGEINVNASVARTFYFNKFNVQFRVDAFNIANHVNYSAPNSGLTVAASSAGQAYFNSPTFGLITASDPPRYLQLVTRISF